MFSPCGRYEPCGLFTITHFIALLICLLGVTLAILLTRNIKIETFTKIIKVIAIIVTILELIKICYNLYYNPNSPINDWLPFHFCSLFIYSLWMSGYFKGKIKTIGDSFMVGGGIIAGFVFLIIPSTSLKLFPIFHFQCLYSLLFHSLFLYLGLMILIKEYFILNLKNYINYLIFCTIFCIIAITLNIIFGANFMFLDNPWEIPIKFLSTIKENNQILYTIIIYLAYVCGTYFTTMLIQKIIIKIKRRKIDV